MSKELTTKDLNRVLGKKELLSAAIGQVVGAGIFSLMPQAIGLTGRSVSLAFLVAAILTIFTVVPRCFVSGTIRMRGGNYTYVSLFGGNKFGGAFIIIHILMNISVCMYAISAAEYLCASIQGLNIRLIAFIIFTAVVVINIVGVKSMARMQAVLVVCLLAATIIFSAFGIVKVDFNAYVQPEGFFSNGIMGFMSAAALLTWATSGAQTIINFSAEAKDPTRDMPPVIIGTTIGIAVLYSIMSIVASGILPVEMVAGQPLSLVAAEILPQPLYIFFIVGGALFAILTTLNSQVGWITKPLLQGCADGWLPSWLGKINDKFRTPHVMLIVLYLIGLIPIVSGFDMDTIAGTSVFASSIVDLMLAACLIRLPKVVPEEWAKSRWHIGHTPLVLWTIVSVAAAVFTAYMSLNSLKPIEMAVNVGIVAIALIFGMLREKHAHIEVSYEAE